PNVNSMRMMGRIESPLPFYSGRAGGVTSPSFFSASRPEILRHLLLTPPECRPHRALPLGRPRVHVGAALEEQPGEIHPPEERRLVERHEARVLPHVGIRAAVQEEPHDLH